MEKRDVIGLILSATRDLRTPQLLDKELSKLQLSEKKDYQQPLKVVGKWT